MSYRKKRNTPKHEQTEQLTLDLDVEYNIQGDVRGIPTSKLTSGLPYQRQINDSVVAALVRCWDDRLLDPLTVSFRDGRFFVVDGQHRIAALRRMNDGRDVIVPCKVYCGLTYEQEAELFYKIDKSKRNLSLAQSLNALVESGTDPDIAVVKQALEANGFVWAIGKSNGRTDEITSARTVINAYHLLGKSEFSHMLALMRRIWHGNPRSLTSFIIGGMALFLKTYGHEIDDHAFVKRMSAIEPEEIIQRGKTDFSTGSNPLRFARVILDKYNTRHKNARKLPYRFNE